MNSNFDLHSQLASNPVKNPRFYKEVNLRNGNPVFFSDPVAARAMIALMDMQAVQGGAASHWGGPASLAEIMSALYGLCFEWAKEKSLNWYDVAHIINDEGHSENGIYALKANYEFANLNIESLKGFRSIKSHLTGHGESHIFPEGVYLSNGPLGSSFPQAQGLAMADKLSGKDRVTVTVISDGACMEGEAKESLAAIPGFAKKGKIAPFILILNDNKTKLSGRIEAQSFSMEPSFCALQDMGWKVLPIKDGNQLKDCVWTIEEAFEEVKKDPYSPIVIHAHTIKGFGVKKTMDSDNGGHGFPLKTPEELPSFLKEIFGNQEIPKEFKNWTDELIKNHTIKKSAQVKKSSQKESNVVSSEKVQVGVAEALVECKKSGLPIVSVSSDLGGSTGVAAFVKEFPDCSFDVGIAESNMVSVGAGFSKQGFIPIVDTFSQFGVTKGALPLIMSSLSQAPVIAIFSHAGFQDAADGASHQALSYFAMTSSIPNTDVYCLSTSKEAKELVTKAIKDFAKRRNAQETPRTSIFFLGRETFPKHLGKDLKYELKKAQVIFDSSDQKEESVTVVSCGPLLHQSLVAAKKVKNKGVVLVNLSGINSPDVETLSECLKKTKGNLLTVEDHQRFGGMGSLLVHHLAISKVEFKVCSLGVKNKFGQSAYSALELYEKHGMDSKAIIRAIEDF